MNNNSVVEIERRFLISDVDILRLSNLHYIDMTAIYLEVSENECERIRVEHHLDDVKYIYTHKKRINRTSRIETEDIISNDEANDILQDSSHFPLNVVTKRRHILPYLSKDDPLDWEIDVFHGANRGLYIVEIELPSEDFDLIIPDWVGEEITQDKRFDNDQLSIHPYTEWK